MLIFVPKQIVFLEPTVSSPLLFLAGPIRGGGDWQADMVEQINRQAQSANIACPARWGSSHRLSQYLHQPFSEAQNRQLEWERHYLKQAGLDSGVRGCIIFWLAFESSSEPHWGPEPYAMDTRREIGKFTAYAETMNVRMAVGGDRGFYGLNVILFELRKALGEQFQFYETMEGVVREALSIARK